MKLLDNFYLNCNLSKQAINETVPTQRYNHEIDTINKIIAVIMTSEKIKNLENFEWIELDHERCAAWIITCDSDEHAIRLLLDNRLIFDHEVLKLEPIRDLSKFSRRLNLGQLTFLRIRLAEQAKSYFGVKTKKDWFNRQSHIHHRKLSIIFSNFLGNEY